MSMRDMSRGGDQPVLAPTFVRVVPATAVTPASPFSGGALDVQAIT